MPNRQVFFYIISDDHTNCKFSYNGQHSNNSIQLKERFKQDNIRCLAPRTGSVVRLCMGFSHKVFDLNFPFPV